MRTLLTLTCLTSALLVGGCSSDAAEEEAQRAADGIAAGLAGGDLPPSLVGAGAQASYDAVVAGLGEVQPTVEAGEVTVSDGTAEVSLAWSWELAGQSWSYDVPVTLQQDGEHWTAAWSPALVEPSLTAGERLDATSLLPARGDVLGARGVRLVTDRPVVRLGIDKTRVTPARTAASARAAARLLGVAPGPFARAVEASGPEAFVEAIVLRPEDARAVPTAYDRIPGAVRIAGTMPLAPYREFAAPILGRVGPVTAELVEASEGRLQPGDVAGLSGLQLRYDEQLTGTRGVSVDAVAEDGTTRELFRAEPVDGSPLRTTLDLRLQARAERVVGAREPATGDGGPPTALVALRPADGAIVAAANSWSTEGQNLATYGQFAPGSTFKVVSALAALRSGLRSDSAVACPASVVVDGKRFENYDDYPPSSLGRITLREAVAQSCNTAFVGLADRLRGAALASAAESLGLGVDFDLGFPAYFGQVPPPSSPTEAAADLIGQGRVLASPMVMAGVAASVAAGRTVVPHLLPDFAPAASPDRPLTRAETASLRSLLRSVVDGGTGSVLADVPGVVGAKTGTAEYDAGGRLRTHGWMIAFTEDLAVAAFVQTGESGSTTAGPLLREFLLGG